MDDTPQDVAIFLDYNIANEEGSYQVTSSNSEGKLLIHSQGKLVFDTHASSPIERESVDLEAIKQRCQITKKGAECYQLFDALGLSYGPRFQVIQEVRLNNTEALSLLQLPPSLQKDSNAFGLHPSMMDGGLQTVMSLYGIDETGKPSARTYLPFLMKEVEVFEFLPERCYAHVTAVGSLQSTDVMKFNIRFLDTNGTPLIQVTDFSVKASQPAQITEQSVETLFYQPSWEKAPVDRSEAIDIDEISSILLFDENDSLRQQLVNRLGSENRNCILIKSGSSYKKLDHEIFEINPHSREDYKLLFKALQEEQVAINKILYKWSNQPSPESSEVSSILDKGVYALLTLSQQLFEQKPKEKIRLLYLYPYDQNAPNPLQSAVSGFAKTIGLENSKLEYKVVGLEKGLASPDAPKGWLDIILEELTNGDPSIAIRYENGAKHVQRYHRFTPAPTPTTFETLGENETYLITGGAGGLGLIFAEHLAKHKAGTIVLTGRSELKPQQKERIQQIESYGATVCYIRADVSNQQGVANLVAEVKDRFQAIHGVIHTAGVLRNSRVIHKTQEELETVLAPKVQGTIYLDEATQKEPLKFFILFSSIAAILGNVGQCGYAYANGFLDDYAKEREALKKSGKRSGKTLAINWPLWKEGGMEASEEVQAMLQRTMGMVAMETEIGLSALAYGLSGDHDNFLVVKGFPGRVAQLLAPKEVKVAEKPKAKPVESVNVQDREGLFKKVQKGLSQIAGGILEIEVEHIEVEDDFNDYGFDSISLTMLANEINGKYGIEVTPDVFFEFTSVASLAEHLVAEAESTLAQIYQPEPMDHGDNRSKEASHTNERDEVVPVETMEATESPIIEPLSQPKPLKLRFQTSLTSESSEVGKMADIPEAKPLVKDDIAIIGMSGTLPQSDDLEAFWNNLAEGKDLITEIPEDRWDWKSLNGNNPNHSDKNDLKWGGFVSHMDKFDANFFGISPREAELMDPQQRLFLETVWKSIEDAGYSATELSGTRTGVFVGVGPSEYREVVSRANVTIDAYSATGLYHSVLANRISYLLNLNGPSEPIDTACSSSLVAIHRAASAIHNDRCEMAIAGGVNLILTPKLYIAFSKAGMLSEDGRCKTFDEKANGYVRAEGVGALLLKPLAQAKTDGDSIYAVIKGSAVNHGGKSASLTAPNPNAQARVLIAAYEAANVSPDTIGYIEAHGTGTSLGDPIEIKGIKKAFTELYRQAGMPLPTTNRCGIGAVKTNIGHSEAATGMAGMMKVILAMKHGQLPPSIHVDQVNPYIALDNSPFYIVKKLQPWNRFTDETNQEIPRRAGVSGFGFGGVNAHVVLEEYQTPEEQRPIPNDDLHVIVLSVKTQAGLKAYVEKFITFLNKPVTDNSLSLKTLQPLMDQDLLVLISEIANVGINDIDVHENLYDLGLGLVNITLFANQIKEKYAIANSIIFPRTLSTVKEFTQFLGEECLSEVTEYYNNAANPTKTASVQEETVKHRISMADLAYTLQVGRVPMEERLAIVASKAETLSDLLEQYTQGNKDQDRVYEGSVHAFEHGGLLLDGSEGEDYFKALLKNKKFAKIVQMWVNGINIDWKPLYSEQPVKRIALPTYPFAKDRHWVKEAAQTNVAPQMMLEPSTSSPTPTVPTPKTTLSQEASEVMSFEEIWQNHPLPLLASNGMHYGLKTILCFLSDTKEQQAFSTAMKATSPQTQIIFIQAGLKANGIFFKKQTPENYQISSIEPSAYFQAFQSILADYESIDGIVYLWALEKENYIKDLSPIVFILQALISLKLPSQQLLLAGEYKTPLERSYLESWIGFERTLPQKHITVVMATPPTSEETALASPMEHWVKRLWGEVASSASSSKKTLSKSVLYEGGERYVCRVQPVSLIKEDTLVQLPYKTGGTYLITGGCGGLGFIFAKHLLEKGARQLILTGRSPLMGECQAKVNSLQAIGEEGSKVFYIQADVCDKADMQAGLAKAKEQFGPIHGLIHSAGMEGAQSLVGRGIEDFNNVLAPKIQGTLILDELLAKEPLDFVCYFSSTAAILGDFGSCDYAIANRFEMAYGRHRNELQKQGKCPGKSITIHWPLWKDGGMGFKEGSHTDENATEFYLKSSGLRLLETQTGLEIFDKILSETASHQKHHRYLIIAGLPSRVHRFLGITESTSNQKTETPLLNAPAHPVQTTRSTFHVSPHQGRLRGGIPRPEMQGLSVEQCLELDLNEQVSRLLKIPRENLNVKINLTDFGFDSISLAEFAQVLSDYYELEITPALFFGYSTLEKLKTFFLEKHTNKIEAYYQEINEPLEHEVHEPEWGETEATMETPSIPWDNTPLTDSLSPNRLGPEQRTEIAIIGMSGRFPQARSIEEMWNILAEGNSVIQEISEDRFDWKLYYGDPTTDPTKTNCKWSGLIPDVSEFDSLFFQISPSEAEVMDPRQRHLLQESWKALEDAGYGPRQIHKHQIGMFVGVEEGSYASQSQPGHLTANHTGILASRLAYFLNLNGPAMAINTACSSGLVAAHQSILSLRSGECDTAIAAGVNLMLSPDSYVTMSQAGMLSPEGTCFAFDRRANGIVPGEAVTVVILKKLSDAEADNDPIHAVIRGSGINHDGKTNGITAPSGVSQTMLLKTVYEQNQINPEEIEYIVTHGTGTKLGDPVEVNALYNTFKEYTPKQKYCALTSVKGNFGHTLAASGLVNLISLIEAMHHECIPGSLHFEEENNYIHWEESPFYVNKRNKSWPRRSAESGQGPPRMGAVSSFGMSGTNAHMVIQEYSRRYVNEQGILRHSNKSPLDNLPFYLLPLSAKTPEALQEKCHDMIHALQKEVDKHSARGGLKVSKEGLAAISYTLQDGRHHFQYRNAIVIEDVKGAIYVWNALQEGEKRPNIFRGKAPRDFNGQIAIKQYIHELLVKSRTYEKKPRNYQELLYALADFYCQGYDIEWKLLYGELVPQKANLPTYPFSRERYWVDSQELTEKEPVEPEPVSYEIRKDYVSLTEEWILSPLASNNELWTARIEAKKDHEILVISEKATDYEEMRQISQRLANLSQKNGTSWNIKHLPIRIESDGKPVPISPLELKPYVTGTTPQTVFLFLPGQHTPDAPFSNNVNEAPAEIQELEFIYTCVQSFMLEATAKPIQFYCCYMDDDQPSNQFLYREGLVGLYKSAILESLDHRYRSISYDEKLVSDNPGQPSVALKLIQEWLCDDTTIMSAAKVPMVRYQKGKRFELQFNEITIPDTQPESTPFREHGTYLMVGPLGAVGEPICQELGRQFQAQLVIFSRRSEQEAQASIARIEVAGASVIYRSVDILDRAALEKEMNSLRVEGVQIQGVIQMARRISDAPILKKGFSAFYDIMAPKVLGTLNLDAVTAKDPLDFFLIYSSMAAFGIKGSSDYAFATAFQNAMVRHRNRLVDQGERSGQSLSLCWGPWGKDEGVGREHMKVLRDKWHQMGLDYIDIPMSMHVKTLCLNHAIGVVGFVAVHNRDQFLQTLGMIPVIPIDIAFDGAGRIYSKIEAFEKGELSELQFADFLKTLNESDYTESIQQKIVHVINRQQAPSHPPPFMSPNSEALVANPSLRPDHDLFITKSQPESPVSEGIQDSIAKVLKIKKETLESDCTFQDYGLDSISAMQLAATLEKKLKISIQPNWFVEYPTLTDLTDKLVAVAK